MLGIITWVFAGAGLLFMVLAISYYVKNDVGQAVKEIKNDVSDDDTRDYTKDIPDDSPEMKKINLYKSIKSSDFKDLKDDGSGRPAVLPKKKSMKATPLHRIMKGSDEDEETELLVAEDDEATELLGSEQDERTEYLENPEETPEEDEDETVALRLSDLPDFKEEK